MVTTEDAAIEAAISSVYGPVTGPTPQWISIGPDPHDGYWQEGATFGPRYAPDELPDELPDSYGWMRWTQTGLECGDGYWQALAPETGAPR